MILLSLNFGAQLTDGPKCRLIFNYDKVNIDQAKEIFTPYEEAIGQNKNIDSVYNIFIQSLQTERDKCVPTSSNKYVTVRDK